MQPVLANSATQRVLVIASLVGAAIFGVACGPQRPTDISKSSDIQLVGQAGRSLVLYQKDQDVFLRNCKTLQVVARRNCDTDVDLQSISLQQYRAGLAYAFNVDPLVMEFTDLATFDTQLAIIREDLSSGQLSGYSLELAERREVILTEARPLFATVILPLLQSLAAQRDIRLHGAYHSYIEQLLVPFTALRQPHLAPYSIDPVSGLAWHKANDVCLPLTDELSSFSKPCLRLTSAKQLARKSLSEQRLSLVAPFECTKSNIWMVRQS